MAYPPSPDNRPGPRGAAPFATPRKPPVKPPVYAPASGVPAATSPAAAANSIAGYTSDAQALIDPVVKSITDRIQAGVKAGSGAISGYANSLADKLGGYAGSARSIYSGAEQAQASSDAALSSALSGGGNDLAQQLAGKLAAINAPQTSQDAYAGAQATTGAGAGNALYGTGSASLADLIAHSASAQDYAAQLPGFARGQGLADIRDLALSSQKNLADQTGELAGKVPDLVLNLRNSAEQKRQYDTSAAENKRQFDVSTEQRTALAKLADATTAKGRQQAWRQFVAATNAANARADSSQANQNARTQAQIDAANTRAAKNRAAATKPASAKPTAKQTADTRKAAVARAKEYYHGVPKQHHYDSSSSTWVDVPDTGQEPVLYDDAARQLATEFGYSLDEAKKILNAIGWKQGEGGRPTTPTPDIGFRDVTLP